MFLASDLGGYAAVVSSVLAQYDAAKSDPRRGAEHPLAAAAAKLLPMYAPSRPVPYYAICAEGATH